MHDTRKSSKHRAIHVVGGAALASAALVLCRPAHALINVGPEAGLVKRSADSPNNLKLGLGYGAHAELDVLPLLKLGPYYFHYELSSADEPTPGAADAAFNTFGLRARLMLPIPGSIKPYGYVGAGYSWVTYTQNSGDHTGHFVETPIGIGVADQLLEIFQLSLDVAYRPGLAFGGTAYDDFHVTQPSSGWSVLIGAALDL
jgi:hypothetical protein